MRTWLRRRRRTDDGFTLIELVITVGLLGIIVPPLVGVVLNYSRTTVDTQARLTESHSVQLAAAYWQRDVASIGVRSGAYDTTTNSFPLEQSVGLPPCASVPADADPVVTMAWTEHTSLDSSAPSTEVKVTYAARADGTAFELLRVRCGSQPSTIQVADNLDAKPEPPVCKDRAGAPIACTGDGAAVPRIVKLKLKVHDDTRQDAATYDVTLWGERRQT